MKGRSTLTRELRKRLRDADLSALREGATEVPESAYDDIFARVAARARRVEAHVEHAQSVVQSRSQEMLDLPGGRQEMLLANSTPTFLVVLARHLMERSFEQCFEDTKRGLALAELAARVAHLATSSDHLSVEDSADLLAEVYGRLANARRIRSHIVAARTALQRARQYCATGTGDRAIRADLLSYEGYLACDTGHTKEAVGFVEQEINLRRLLGDKEPLGRALIHRGWLACWVGSLSEACRYHREGMEMTDDPRLVTVGLLSLALRLVRDGEGLMAWRALSSAYLPLELAGDRRLKTEHRWVRGLALHALGEAAEAVCELEAVRETLREEGSRMGEAFISLDLACIEIGRGAFSVAAGYAGHATEIFRERQVDRPMLTALTVLSDAIRKQRATEQLALDVAHFLRRYQLDRTLRFRTERS